MVKCRIAFWLAVSMMAVMLVLPMCGGVLAQTEDAQITELIPGDVNGDTTVSTVDVRGILRYIVGSASLTAEQVLIGDVTADGALTSEDARLIMRTLTQESTTVLHGIDVSYAQGEIDWQTVQKSGVDFAILRCGYGQDEPDQDDDYWETNAAACEELGIPYGAYFFCYARNASEAIGEAKHALRLLEGKNLTLPIFLDMEYSDYQGDLSNAEYAAIAKYFCTTLSNAGYQVGVYANLNWWETRLTDPCFDQWYRWIAQYNDECEYEGTYHLWQYSDGVTIPGITENATDANYCYIDFVSLHEERRGLV